MAHFDSCKSYKKNCVFYITVIFIYFYNVFVLDSLKISSILNFRLPGPRRRARSHIVLGYNNENMTFIRLLLANQIAYIFRSNDKSNIDKQSVSFIQGLICL